MSVSAEISSVAFPGESTGIKMPHETNHGSLFTSPCKNLRGLRGLIPSNEACYPDEIINDRELAQRKAEEAGKKC